ncbi:apoptosis facilitator Bcl-2-like protein 14 isoform X2 [Paroedura picta]|uniref:apoptosis facilitator Bcl-2-like protein 14 isoform X2 n=1 Tax=Paroedura picta TaxID=143630 RepID=UPI0040569E73
MVSLSASGRRCNMSFANFSSMEDISLADEEGSSVEFKVLMAYTQRRLSASKFSQLLERGAEGQGGSDQGQASLEKPPVDKKKSQKKTKKKKKTKGSSKWKRFLSPPCLRGQIEEDPGKSEVNGKQPEPQAGIGRKPVCISAEAQEDLDIVRVADKLAELVDHSRSRSTIEGRGLLRTMSLEKDGGGPSKLPSKTVPYEDDRKDDEEKIIDTIVAMLRKSGDELEEKMQKDKNFHLSFCDLMSYSFFGRIADQVLEEVPVDSTGDSEAHIQRTKVAYVMEVTTRLTAVDNHPMNLVLGFGTKYLKENFMPWICSQGGLKKAVGLLDQEEVE